MHVRWWGATVLVAAWVIAGCGDDWAACDAVPVDTGPQDAAPPDAGAPDDAAPDDDATADDAAPDDAGTGPICPSVPASGSAECRDCLARRCCLEAEACVADTNSTGCRAWLACEGACAIDDFGCRRDCWVHKPAGREKAELLACKERSCAAACGAAACGENYGYYQVPDDACRACWNEHCCDERRACLENADCQDADECFNTSTDWDACTRDEHYAGRLAFAPLVACHSRYCGDLCAYGTQPCGYFWFPLTCQTCVHDNCCAEFKACSDDAACLEHAFCSEPCAGDPTCLAECDALYWAGGGPDHTRLYCQASKCATACAVTPASCGGLPTGAAACDTCLEQQCCAEGEACGTDPECASVAICERACGGDAGCRRLCQELGTTAGVARHRTRASCLGTRCAAECGITGGACGVFPLDAACSSILVDHCCAQGAAVTLDPAAMSLELCLERCERSAACEAVCMAAASAPAQALVGALRTCMTANNGAACMLPMTDATAEVGGRPYAYKVPPAYDPAVPTPLVMLLHGYGFADIPGQFEESRFKLAPVAAARTWLYVLPQGLTDAVGKVYWNGTDACCGSGPRADDVAHLRAVIADLASKFNVDPKRVFVSGWSNGGYMAHRMGCDAADVVAAIVAFAGNNWYNENRCQPTAPVAALQIHGDADTAVLYNGGWAFAQYPSAHASVGTWVTRNGCSSGLALTGETLDLDLATDGAETLVERATCAAGAAELWTVQGGGHGLHFSDAWAPSIFDFFAAHPKP
jgi:polyhydroxybutyrate depolymerase